MNLIYVSIEYLRKLGNPQPSLGPTKFWGWSAKRGPLSCKTVTNGVPRGGLSGPKPSLS